MIAKKLLKDTFIYGLGSFASKCIGLILLPFYTRVFSVGDYGILDILSITVMFTMLIVSLQIDQGFARFFAAARSVQEKRSYGTTALFYYSGSFFCVMALIIMFSANISQVLFSSD